MAPQQVGRYQVLDQLGQGAVGDVYRAYDPDLDRQVAIKVLSRSLSPEADNLRQRFRREVQIAAHLNHPHIVTVYDVGLEHDPPYVVMELLSGGTLEDLLRGQMLLWPAALQLIDPICQALAYAHEAGIVHRDIKPSNIMRAGDAAGTLK
ncbi:MAG: serine/threonine-protein kinase, partial [Candidatus Promineifilaceae bacterium]